MIEQRDCCYMLMNASSEISNQLGGTLPRHYAGVTEQAQGLAAGCLNLLMQRPSVADGLLNCHRC
jgi:hypothetical protein